MNDRWQKTLKGVAVVGFVLTLLGWIIARDRTCAGVLVAASYAIGLGLGGLLFVAFAYLTKAGWSVALRRIPEAMAATLPLGSVLMVVALAGMPVLYEWMHAHDELTRKKAPWLNAGFFMVRSVIYLAAWLVFSSLIRRCSRDQDESGHPGDTARNTVLSTLFIIVFAATFSLASFDWIMSLEAHWFSTVFAVYNFSGLFVATLASITILAIVLRRLGPLAGIVKADHLHDLGRLTLGFTTFWGYIWFCQYMLIWYANIPEETSYYVSRFSGAWGPLTVVNPVVNWLIPFLVLLPRPAKRDESVMFWVACVLLVGHWLDLYLMVAPAIMPSPRFGVFEIGPMAVALPAMVLAFFAAFARVPPVPRGDPMLRESLHHQA
ncbi:MAG: hypothetical protein ACYTGN_06555 [Planctomycetota bacterium]|jgi:hypothetical protein